MKRISTDVAVTQLLSVLREAVEGPSGSWSYFLDNRPGAGLLPSLRALSAAEASGEWAGSTIAAHVHHAAFALRVSAAGVRGDQSHADWAQSWSVKTVGDEGWLALLDELERSYHLVRDAIADAAAASDTAMGEAVGALAHVAYHLGAIGQKLAAGRSR